MRVPLLIILVKQLWSVLDNRLIIVNDTGNLSYCKDQYSYLVYLGTI